MQALLTIAVRAARKAGDFIIKESDRIKSVSKKAESDYVTNVDKAAEQIILDTIRHAYPEHSFLAEESGASGDHDFQWVIDPIDGTTNFIHGVPHWSISIACKHKGKTQVGVIYDPIREELFTAVRGRGAQLNSRRIRVSNSKGLAHSLLATGFPFRNKELLESYQTIFNALFAQCSDMRRAGSAALDLAWVAAGRFDGFWEFGLSEWDIAAGLLIIQEAGGMVSDLQGNPNIKESDSLLAASPKVFKEILQAIKA